MPISNFNQAMMMGASGQSGFDVLGALVASDSVQAGENGNSATGDGGLNSFTVPFGDADTDRKILILSGVSGQVTSSSGLSSMTIGGITATIIKSQVDRLYTGAILIADVPTGTSGILHANVSGSNRVNYFGFHLLSLIGNWTSGSTVGANSTNASSQNVGSITVPKGSTLFVSIHTLGNGSETATLTYPTDFNAIAEIPGPPNNRASNSYKTYAGYYQPSVQTTVSPTFTFNQSVEIILVSMAVLTPPA